MKIGGFQKNSMIDFPGVVACVVYTSGCNFNCPYCHNPDLAVGLCPEAGGFIPEEEVFSFLEKRKGLVDGVVISGGEPTLQPSLERFCLIIKTMGFKVKLDTNGSRPEVLEALFEKNMLDFVAMDIKSNLPGYSLAAGEDFDSELITRSIKLIIEKAPSYEFRTTCIKPFLDKTIISDIGNMSKGASHHILQQCSRNVAMLNSEFFDPKQSFFTDDEMLELKAEVENHVAKCSVR